MKEQLDKETLSLNALVDKELDQPERDEMLARIDQDAQLRNQLTDLYHLKEMVRSAYPDDAEYSTGGGGKFGQGGAIAAGLLLLAAVFAGGYQAGNHSAYTPADIFQLSQTTSSPGRVMLYLYSDKEEKFRQTLDQAQSYLSNYRDDGINVIVVTSSEGINLLRESAPEYKERIEAMKVRYGDSVNFVACNNTITRFRNQGIPVDLIDTAEVAPSAVQYVVNRLREGWTYVAI